MRVTSFVALSLGVLPALVSAGLFSEGGPVKMLQDKVFRRSLKSERTAVVAFVAPWCGHCKALTPEYSKAAQSLSPLIDFYAVDCDADENKRLCAEQGIRGFPTIKSFPRGAGGPAKEYQGERKAASIVSWANGEVPVRVTNLKTAEAVEAWTTQHAAEPRALLLTTHSKVPVMWKVLAAQYDPHVPSSKSKSPSSSSSSSVGKVAFGAIKDETGAVAAALGLQGGGGDVKSQVVFWKKGDQALPFLYDGLPKYEGLSLALEELRSSAKAKDNIKDEL